MWALIRNNASIIFIVITLLALLILNSRITALDSTNKRLTQLADSKDEQIHQLRSENNNLAASITDLIAATEQQNKLIEEVIEQRKEADLQSREFQNEIVKALADNKCAAERVPDNAAEWLRAAAKATGRVPEDKNTGAVASGQPAK